MADVDLGERDLVGICAAAAQSGRGAANLSSSMTDRTGLASDEALARHVYSDT